MFTAAIILSLTFTLLGFFVTVNNAKYILSGYNTMSEADRAKMDIEQYLRFFKRFHLILGATLLAGYLILQSINNNWASAYLILYPLLSYVFLIGKGVTFYHGTSGQRVGTFVGMAILVVITIAIGMQLFASLRNSEVFLTIDQVQIKGMYGIRIDKDDITGIALVRELPPISHKTNGFAAGNFAKGSFKTVDGQPVRLYVNKKAKPFLEIRTTGHEAVYYSSDEMPAVDVYRQLRTWRIE
ncbi:DUF3784 domain-containing protein [Dyadobacter sandarakinus]|uniref:DUF3784 domain-containing protein n=1 Tax=Dyadobacter sandarakinus TaxID=2747268 RepID=A0ABX7I984_9BACT|nr:DUF3784 domain-containing protein [Dyadobacter sandarakinus]QRR02540.1 DUF3784 domain-containing protein [Dyadobacter sandarakinus]